MRKVYCHCNDRLLLSLLQAISHSENTYINLTVQIDILYINTEKAFLHSKKACDVASQGLTVPEQDRVRIPKTDFHTEIRDPFIWPEPS